MSDSKSNSGMAHPSPVGAESAGVILRITAKLSPMVAWGRVVALGIMASLPTVTIPASAAQPATSTAPSTQSPDPIAAKPPTILGRPDRLDSATGAELIRKRFDLIKQVVPGAARVAVLWQPVADSDAATVALQNAGKAASALGVSVQFLAAGDLSQLEAAFSGISTGEVDAILVIPGPMLNAERKYIVQSIAKTRLPAMYDNRVFVEDGGLMSYGSYRDSLRPPPPPHPENILHKTNPTDITVEQPTKFELVINLKTAKALGLEIPPSLLARADEVIE